MIFYFRLITQPCFILDLNYKNSMTEVVRLIRKQPTLPTKQSNAKIILESKNRTNVKITGGTYSVHGKTDKKSTGISEPGRSVGSSRKTGSSVNSTGDQDHSSSVSNSHIAKHFGPLFEEYRRIKAEMRFSLLGPAVHIPFGSGPTIKSTESKKETPISRKAVNLGNANLAAVELKTNDFANSIIDKSQLAINTEAIPIRKIKRRPIDQKSTTSESTSHTRK